MVRAFGGPREPLVIEWQRSLAMAGQPTEPVAPPCIHKFKECDFGRYARCMFCGFESREQVRLEPRCPPGAELHHRNCALRQGGCSCTCNPP